MKEGILHPVKFSDWAAPIVPVVKKDGRIRICGDYKLTANRASLSDPYPIPRIDNLLASTAKAKIFSKLMPTSNWNWTRTPRNAPLSLLTKVRFNTTVYHLGSPLHHHCSSAPWKALWGTSRMSSCTSTTSW